MERRSRRNLLDYPVDLWRPPSYRPASHGWSALRTRIDRFFDLQSATIWRDLSEVLPDVRGSVLDVGCGLQPYRHLFHPGVRYHGIDDAEAKSHFGFDVEDVVYYSGNRWPVQDRRMDFILCTETLEHLPDPRRFLSEAIRCLRPGGQALFTVPFAVRWHYIPHDYWRYTPSGLERLLRQAGFVDIRVWARGNVATVACYKGMALFFSLLFPGPMGPLRALGSRLLGLTCSPIVVLLATIAHLTGGSDGTTDCIGYTVQATRPGTAVPKRRRP